MAADGVVEYAGFHGKSGFGNLLIIIHNYGFKSYYAHLNGFKVKTGDIISKGQEVALTGLIITMNRFLKQQWG